MNETLLFIIGTVVFAITVWGLLMVGYKTTVDAGEKDRS
tara:strand:- start:172 stop:288 length:117 start_codon:yes stop_codon:yes gene_type:complete